MIVCTPLNLYDEIEPLVEAGAGEFYAGVSDPEWVRNYSWSFLANRREEPKCSFPDSEKLGRAAAKCRELGADIFFALNNDYYTPEEYDILGRMCREAVEAGVARIIVGDLGLALYLRETHPGTPLVMSLGGIVFNSEARRFARELGFTRVILDRHVNLSEIRQIVGGPEGDGGMEYEAFLFNGRCPHTDGLCSFHHVYDPKENKRWDYACKLDYQVTDLAGPGRPVLDPIYKEKLFHYNTRNIENANCGVCALPRLKAMGVEYVKVVGRGWNIERKVKDIRFIREAMDRMDAADFVEPRYIQETIQRYNDAYGGLCSASCYYGADYLEHYLEWSAKVPAPIPSHRP